MLSVKSRKLYNAFTVLVGGMLLGFCWRVRGNHGWGSSWGLLFAGLVFTMFIILAVGERKRLDFGWLGLTAVSFMLTVPSWGTLLSQITGILHSEELWGSVENPTVNYVSPASAIFLMLCLGFGLATIWGVLLGRAYSGKQWKLKDFIIIIAVFYAVNYLTKATVSHVILNLVQPQAAEVYARYLNEAGITDSVYSTYMKHFDNLAWAKRLDGGRNYFSSIQAISSMLSSAAVLISTRFIVKDKRSANIGFTVSAGFSFAITAADVLFFLSYGGYHMEHAPYITMNGVWGMWEYMTGFIAGAVITLVMLKMKREDDVSELVFTKVPLKVKTALTFLLSFIFVFGANIVRPVLERFRESETPVIIVAVVIAVIVAAVIIFTVAAKCGFALEKIHMTDFVKYALPLLCVYTTINYLFIGSKTQQLFRYSGVPTTWLVVISTLVLVIWCFVSMVIVKRKEEK